MGVSGADAYADFPIEEIRLVIAQKALESPSSALLAALDAENLNKGLQKIDRYACYIPPSKFSKASSDFLRLGINIFKYKSKLWISPDVGGPAERAGMPEIAILKAIGNTKLHSVNLAGISKIIDKSIYENYVIISVYDCSDKKEKNYKVEPVVFKSPTITHRKVGGFTIIRIREFVARETANKLSDIYKTVIRSSNHVIIDLRDCSGGDLYEAIEVASKFVPSGLLLVSTQNHNGFTQAYHSPTDHKFPRPICLLIDHQTASAGEILARILQYYHFSLLVGERSFGKCVSQTFIPLSNGGGLWLTNLRIYFPDNQSCTAGKGFHADISYSNIKIANLSDIIKKVNRTILFPH